MRAIVTPLVLALVVVQSPRARADAAGLPGMRDTDLLFYAPLDGVAAPKVAAGGVKRVGSHTTLEFVPGRVGAALAGATAVRYPRAGNLALARGTISFWLRADSATRQELRWRQLLSMGANHFQIHLHPEAGDLQFCMQHATPAPEGCSYYVRVPHEALTVDTWHHVAVTWQSGRADLYFDGRHAGSNAGEHVTCPAMRSFKPDETDIVVGGDAAVAIDEFRIYRTVWRPAAEDRYTGLDPEYARPPTPFVQSNADTGWELRFSDDFSAREIGGAWLFASARSRHLARVEEGALAQGRGCMLTLKPEFGGDQRLEYSFWFADEWTEAHGAFICSGDGRYFDGYYMSTGRSGDGVSVCMRKGRGVAATEWDAAAPLVVAGKRHRVLCQRAANRITWIVDGQVVADFVDGRPLTGRHIGIHLATGAKLDDVKVYTRRGGPAP